MGQGQARIAQGETDVTVRYWAAARAAAGVGEDRIPTDGPLTLAEVRVRALALHPEADTLPRVIASCSVLVGDTPLGRRDPADVTVAPGSSVEFLPPFAGG
jgi:molybdopterin converting factor small subunit